MRVNVSVLEVPLEYQGITKGSMEINMQKWNNSKLKDLMFLTAEPLYQNKEVEFKKLIWFVKSDYRQYSPFIFENATKKSENWNNSKQNLLIFDIDDGLSLEDAKKMFSKYEYLIATTKSHRQVKKDVVCDRFRVIIPSNNIPRGDTYFEMMRVLESRFTFIDKQVNTKTGAFLGFFNCNYWYNEGILFDCEPIIQMIKPKEVINTHKTNINIPTTQKYTKGEGLPIEEIKSRLTREIVADIVSSCGYEVNRKFMFKYRQNEKTPSASISPELLIKDFGSELSTDVIGFVMQVNGIDFKTAVVIVAGFVNVSIA
jgi:hypothetical protein